MAYTAGSITVRAIMEADTGLPADRIVSTFNFELGAAPAPADYTDLFGFVDEFFNTAGANTRKVGEFISAQVDRSSTHELEATVITAGALGSPDASIPWLGPVAPTNNTGLPTECAGVLSYHADLTGLVEESGVTRPRARRRGRLFVGPLTEEALNGTTPPYLLSDVFLATLRQAAVRLHDQAVGWLPDSASSWAVWSRENTTLYPVVGGWTENAPDTQRRRGPDASARVAWVP